MQQFFILYVTLLFHLVVTGTQILYMQIIIESKSQLNNTIGLCISSVTLPDSVFLALGLMYTLMRYVMENYVT